MRGAEEVVRAVEVESEVRAACAGKEYIGAETAYSRWLGLGFRRG